MQSSIEVLKTTDVRKHKTQQQPITSSPSTIRKLDSRSNDDLTKHPPTKRISKKNESLNLAALCYHVNL